MLPRPSWSRVVSTLCLALSVAPAALLAQLNIARQPDALVTVPSGQPATLSVAVTGATAPTYQWRRYGHPIAGATNATYQIPAVRQADNDFYDVLVTSGGTTALSQSARLLVTLPSYPQAVTVDLSRSFALEGVESTYDGAGPAIIHAALPDGRYYIAGTFSTVDGQARRNLVRFNANGTLDASFTAPALDARPAALAVQPDGKLLVAGTFRTVDGAPSEGIIRLNADGTRDTTFKSGVAYVTALPGSIHAAANGNIYLTGGAIGTPVGSLAYIARLRPDGTLDTTFTSPTFGYGSGSINPSGFVFGPNGEIYVYGSFERVNGIARPRIARLLQNGALDTSFNPGTGPNGFIYGITVLSTGQVVIGGDFTAYNGTAVGRIARLTTSGALDSSFATGSGFSSQVSFLAALPNGAVFVGSVGGTYNGTFTGNGARLNANGTLDTSFTYSPDGRPDALSVLPGNRLLVTGYIVGNSRPAARVLEPYGSASTAIASPTFRFPARARVLTPLPGGKVLVGGDFTHVNGTPAPFVMRLNADLTRDTAFPAGPGPTSQVLRSLVQPDGKIVLFTYSTMLRLNADGSTDSSFAGFTPGGFFLTAAQPVLLPDGRFFVPTDAPFWGGSPVTNGLVILESNGTRASTHAFSPGPNPGTRITGVQRLASGRLLVIGTFTTWNGIARNNAVRLNADGSVDPTFTPDSSFPFAQFSSGLARHGWSLQRDGRLVLSSDRQPNDSMGRLDADGTRDRTFVSGLPQLFSGASFLVQPDDRILVVAQGTPSLNTPPTGSLPNVFARLTPNGALDPSFSVSGSGFWMEMMLADNGELLSSDNSGYLHRYKALPAPVISVPPSSASAVAGNTIQLRVTATGDEPLAYQWFKDGVAISGATSATLTLEHTLSSATGSYTVAVSNAGGTVTSPAAVVTIVPRPLAGAYFGTIDGNGGNFALYLREDGSGAFLGYLRTPRLVLSARNISVGSDRRFRFMATGNASGNTPTNVEVQGSIASDGAVTGTALGFPLAAAPAATSGPTAAHAGFYVMAEPGTSGLSYAIVGANGSGYAAVIAGGRAEAGATTIASTGNVTGPLESGTAFSGSIGADGRATTTLLPTGSAPLAFIGGDSDKRGDVEKLVNISTRSLVRANDSFTVGFVVIGDRPKPVLVRAIGPTLAAFQVDGPLTAARLEVFRGTNSIAVGNDWGLAANATTIAATAARVGAFALPAASRDATLLLTLEPGNYSAQVTGQGGASGVALIEVYDATEGAIPRGQRIVNLSTLAVAGTGSDTLTAGFYVSGTVPKRVLIRGVGPGLTQFNVPGVLARPQVAVYSGNTQLARAASWSGSPDAAALAAAASQVGAFAFPAGSADAALIINLSPGSYTAQVSGVDNSTGTALVEIYELP